MEAIDVLRHHRQHFSGALQPHDSIVCRVGLRIAKLRPAFQLVIPMLDSRGLRPHKIVIINQLPPPPNPGRPTEVWNPAAGRDARAGEEQHVLRDAQIIRQLVYIRLHGFTVFCSVYFRHPALYVPRMPIPVITIAQMREWEKATWASGQTEAEVIRRVGKCLAAHALRLTRSEDLILILAGKGNNGADARASQDHLAQRRVDFIEVKDPAADLSKLEVVLSLRPALIIDGLFGIGINRPLSADWIGFIERVNTRGEKFFVFFLPPPPALHRVFFLELGINRPLSADWIRFIERVNSSGAKILAVDVPSGLNGDTGEPQGAAIRASTTLTVGAPKTGMLKESAWPFVGRLEVAREVGLVASPLKSEVNWTLAQDFDGFPPTRSVGTHKGTYGHVGIIAGSVGYHGAS